MKRSTILVALFLVSAMVAAAGKKPPPPPAGMDQAFATAQALPAPGLPVLAVMALENTSGKADDDWMGIGFAESITTKLARLKNVKVVERRQIDKAMQEVALSQTGAMDPRSVVSAGKLLAANYLVIGSVQKLEAGTKSQLLVNTRVLRTETGEVFQTLSERGPYDEIFDLQDRLSLKIAEALAVPVSLAEKREVSRNQTDSRGAYEFFWMGMAATDLGLKKTMYQKAVGLDPKYVSAIANLASVLMVENLSCPEPDFSEAREMALKAAGLDSTNAEVHWILGSIYRREGKKKEAIRELETHLLLDPSSQYKDMVERILQNLKK